MSDLADFTKRLGALEEELTEAARTGDVRGQIRLHYARAAAWTAFSKIQKEAGRDHLPALGAAARDEAAARRLEGSGPRDDGDDPAGAVSIVALMSAVLSIWVLRVVLGPLALLLGLIGVCTSRRHRVLGVIALFVGATETFFLAWWLLVYINTH